MWSSENRRQREQVQRHTGFIRSDRVENRRQSGTLGAQISRDEMRDEAVKVARGQIMWCLMGHRKGFDTILFAMGKYTSVLSKRES